jgi:hypothetical protein
MICVFVVIHVVRWVNVRTWLAASSACASPDTASQASSSYTVLFSVYSYYNQITN